MGYESKIYIARKHGFNGCTDWNEVLATFDLCKMNYDIYKGNRFRDLFTIPLTGSMYMDDGNTEIHKDCYGDEVEGAYITDVMDWLEEYLKDNDWYRARIFYDLLKSFQKHSEGELILYHYGY